MAFNFPDAPNVNDEFTAGDRTWVWNGTVWIDKGSTLSFDELTNSTHAATHESGGADVLTLAQDQVTGLANGTSGYSAVSDGSTLTYQPVSHNYIINGAFDIWQRGTSESGFSNNRFLADRWETASASSLATLSVSQEEFANGEIEAIGFGDAKFFRRQTATSVNGATWQQVKTFIEDVKTLSNQTVTLSFWAKVTGETAGLVYIAQHFGSGGDATDFHTANATFTTSWQRYEFQLSLPSVSGKTIGPNSYLEVTVRQDLSADGDTIDLWGVQLETGSVATPFKRNAPSLQGELAACQRYYYAVTNPTVAGRPAATVGYYNTTTAYGVVHFPTTMRTTPTVTFTNVAAWNVLSGGTGRPTTNLLFNNGSEVAATIGFITSATTAGNAGWAEALTGQTGSINFSAEL